MKNIRFCSIFLIPILLLQSAVTAQNQEIMGIIRVKHNLENRRYTKSDQLAYLFLCRQVKTDARSLPFLENAISHQKEELIKKFMDYKYVSPLSSIHYKSNTISWWEYLKIVKYSLFEMNADTLLALNEIPFMKEPYEKNRRLEKQQSDSILEYLKKRKSVQKR